jgi:CheY-like chemotaxis protein
VTIEPEFSLDQPRQINHLAADGVLAKDRLRARPAEKGGAIPAIAVTAFYENYPPAQLSDWAAYFQKPLQIEQLVETIAAILGRGGPATTPRT